VVICENRSKPLKDHIASRGRTIGIVKIHANRGDFNPILAFNLNINRGNKLGFAWQNAQKMRRRADSVELFRKKLWTNPHRYLIKPEDSRESWRVQNQL
jgi:hypothetical protein